VVGMLTEAEVMPMPVLPRAANEAAVFEEVAK